MPLVCLHCAMRAYLDDQPAPNFGEQTREEHMRVYHPDLEATKRERAEMEFELTLRYARGELNFER